MEWTLFVAITDSPVLKNRFNRKRIVCPGPTHDHKYSDLKNKKIFKKQRKKQYNISEIEQPLPIA